MAAAGVCALWSAAPSVAADANFRWFHYKGSDPVDAVAKPGAGEFRNPVLAGFYPDPSIVRVGPDYYLVNSSFSWFPGVPVWHSRDLVSWRQIGNAIDRPGMVDFKGKELSQGLFAPTISWHDGIFYIANTCFACGGNYIVTATNPAGPWSQPHWFPELGWGIDPSLFFDEDGSAWLLNNDVPPGGETYPGHRAVFLQRLDLPSMKLVGPRRMILNGGVKIEEKPEYVEGPHIFRKDGFYYLTVAEGGTGEKHAQVVLRARELEGPYEPFAGNPILTQRGMDPKRPFPVSSAGHADLVQTQAGDWWAVFLATRPYRDDIYNTGRETFLLPVQWTADGWPTILKPDVPIPHVVKRPSLPRDPAPPLPTSGPFEVRDEFDGSAPGLHWMTMRGPADGWMKLGGGTLTLTPRAEGLGDLASPSFVARRQQHMNMEASTLLSFKPGAGEAAGLGIIQRDEYWFALLLADAGGGKREVRLLLRDGAATPAAGKLLARAPVPDGDIRLRIVAEGERYRFDWAPARGEWRTLLADTDGTVLSTWRAQGFVGAMVGPYAVKVVP
ncbi:glycoside hydrolase family 43 protein [Sandaracinobacter neustonicus]|uniref:Glycoside hydrolase family 43 protein n=2 Tax=Sandaracinobacter neustonicus TaxID=1715348 RepID=A0A501XPU1_9SPHN|nr:glycoside hydrolase family 43 protein [Sandaracinobacter neustonicus]